MTKTLDAVWHDHDRFRALLGALESALEVGVGVRFVARELCLTLERRLQDHMRREEELIAACQVPLGAKELEALADGHENEAAVLHRGTRYLTEAPSPEAVEEILGPLSLAIAQFRYNMEAQEYKLFPAIAWVLAASGVQVLSPGMMDGLIAPRPKMPVNRIRQWELVR